MSKLRSQANLVTRAKRYLKNHKSYILVDHIRKCIRQVRKFDTRFLSLKPKIPAQGNVLLAYVIDPFLLKAGEPILNSHTFYWENLQIAKTFLDLGYCVDVIHYNNNKFFPTKDYSFFVGHRINFERTASLLNKDCVKILHIDVAHWLSHNSAQYRRLLEVQRRKKITLPGRKLLPPNWAIEDADCATILGNEFTIRTYSYANKPTYSIPISTPVLYPWPEGKDLEANRKRYLWFGSDGFIHKGLDLLLDAFAEMPEYHLTICGPLEMEPAFVRAYRKELFETPNIEVVGWVDISSQQFMEICNRCVALVYCSCAEGGGGGVITCIHAGLIPIISQESSVDVDGFGFTLKTCSIEEIKQSVQTVANLPKQELIRRARAGWEFARANHTRETFARRYRDVVTKIITSRDIKNGSRAAWNLGSRMEANATR